jgi:hypothetical protein
VPASELELLRARSKGRALIENFIWRALFVSAPIVLALVYLKSLLDWLGDEQPSAKTVTGVATLLALAVVSRRSSGSARAPAGIGKHPV